MDGSKSILTSLFRNKSRVHCVTEQVRTVDTQKVSDVFVQDT